MMTSILQRNGFRSVREMEAAWSMARLVVDVEVNFHTNYMPDDDAPQELDVSSLFPIEDVD